MLTIIPRVASVSVAGLWLLNAICFIACHTLISIKATSRRRTAKQQCGVLRHSQLQSTILLLFVGCLTSQQQASVSQGRICSDNFTCCHTEIDVADQTFYLTQSQYTDTRPTSPSADPITPGAWQGSHWSANV